MADFTLDSVVSCLKVISQGDSAPQARAKAESSLLKFEKQRGFIQACLVSVPVTFSLTVLF